MLYGPWLLLLAPKIHTAVPLKVKEAEAPYVVVSVNVPLSVYLKPPFNTHHKRRKKNAHDCQNGSAVDPSNHAPGGKYSITGLKSSKVTFTVRTIDVVKEKNKREVKKESRSVAYVCGRRVPKRPARVKCD